jgi:hypothetical protein
MSLMKGLGIFPFSAKALHGLLCGFGCGSCSVLLFFVARCSCYVLLFLVAKCCVCYYLLIFKQDCDILIV